jgi:hypothetical protein
MPKVSSERFICSKASLVSGAAGISLVCDKAEKLKVHKHKASQIGNLIITCYKRISEM